MSTQAIDIAIIAHQIYPFYIGGTEVAMQNLATSLNQKGYRVVVVTRKTPQSQHIETSVPHVFVRTTNIAGLRLIFFMISAMFAVMKLGRVRVAVVVPIDHSWMCYFLKHMGIFTINWARGSDIYDSLFPFAVKQSIESSNITFALSRAIQSLMSKYSSRRTYYIPNGFSIPVDLQKSPQNRVKSTKEPIRLVYAGRLIFYKRVDFAIEALKVLESRGGGFTLDIIGWGPEFDNLQKLSQSLGIEDKIRFHGRLNRRRDVFNLEKQSDIFLYPSSRGQGLGNAVLEAMVLGLPVLSFHVGYFPELIGQDTRGWIVANSKNRNIAIDNLVEKLLEIREKPEDIRIKGKLASHFVTKNFIWDEVVKKMIGIINRVIET